MVQTPQYGNSLSGTLPTQLAGLTALKALCARSAAALCPRGEAVGDDSTRSAMARAPHLPPRMAPPPARLHPGPLSPPPAGAPLACRRLQSSSLSGTLPTQLAALTVLTQLCARHARLPPCARRVGSQWRGQGGDSTRRAGTRVAPGPSHGPAARASSPPPPLSPLAGAPLARRIIDKNSLSGTLPTQLGGLTYL